MLNQHVLLEGLDGFEPGGAGSAVVPELVFVNQLDVILHRTLFLESATVKSKRIGSMEEISFTFSTGTAVPVGVDILVFDG